MLYLLYQLFTRQKPMSWLITLGLLSILVYIWAFLYGSFRPDRITGFFPIFGCVFVLYAVAVRLVLKAQFLSKRTVLVIFAFAAVFNGLLIPTRPTLSDDMYRYIWDGRVQANGINPYRYPSNAAELFTLRDPVIWVRMNRLDAVTIYPPGAQLVFALIWRLMPDSVIGFKLLMVYCVLMCGWLLARLLEALGERPERVLIFLWNPLLVFEIAHSGHVDALLLPLMVGALLVRAVAPRDRVSIKHEALIGFLLGASVLVKLYPVILLIPLWNIRDSYGKRRWRLALPLTTLLTVAAGYALYLTPDVDTLGFLPKYVTEYSNVGPLPMVLIQWAQHHQIDFYKPTQYLMPALVGLVSFWFLIKPASSARAAITRCAWPIGTYLIISQNSLSWYMLWILPLTALNLQVGRWLGWQLDASFAWWLFSGLIALSYSIYITGYRQEWAINIQFVPLYGLLIASFLWKVISRMKPKPEGVLVQEAV